MMVFIEKSLVPGHLVGRLLFVISNLIKIINWIFEIIMLPSL